MKLQLEVSVHLYWEEMADMLGSESGGICVRLKYCTEEIEDFTYAEIRGIGC